MPRPSLDPSLNSAEFMGVRFAPLTMKKTVSVIENALVEKKRLQHVVINVAKLVNLRSDASLRKDVMESDLVNVDGMGVVWGARLCGVDVPERVSGIDLMHQVLKLCMEKGYRCYFLGAKEEVLATAIRNIETDYPGIPIAGSRNGYFDESEEDGIVSAIRDAKTDCLFIAISSPKKERIIHQYRDAFGASFLMGVGGSIDVVAGYVTRAPLWMQKSGLEWLYRVIQEPGRMWKRYLITNSKFLFLLIGELFRRKND